MIKIENIETFGWEAALRGMRNPKNSWNKSDSKYSNDIVWTPENIAKFGNNVMGYDYCIGENDMKLASTLTKAGTEHRKFTRMIHVQMDITAPMFWWSEFDTYKIGTTRNSCSKMHTIHIKPFELDDFAHEGCKEIPIAYDALVEVILACDQLRNLFNETHDRKYWRALIELLPESYMMKATWDGSFETMLNIMHQRDGHKLKEEWEPFRKACFDNIPYLEEFYNIAYKKGE